LFNWSRLLSFVSICRTDKLSDEAPPKTASRRLLSIILSFRLPLLQAAYLRMRIRVTSNYPNGQRNPFCRGAVTLAP
jgi:hypothetical protein